MENKSIIYETINHNHWHLPVYLFEQKRSSDSIGAFLHWHEQIELYYIVSGGLALLCNGQEDWLYTGDIGFVNWCEPHRGTQFLENTQFFTIQIDLPLLDATLIEDHLAFVLNQYNAIPTYIKKNDKLNTLFKTLIDEYQKKDQAHQYMIKSTLYGILGSLIRESTHNNQKTINNTTSLKTVQKILGYINNHYTSGITLQNLAHEFGLSKSHMCHIFKEYTNQTIHHYINELRCQKAMSLIINKTPLSEVYQAVGFNDYNYFSRVFKKVYGATPRKL